MAKEVCVELLDETGHRIKFWYEDVMSAQLLDFKRGSESNTRIVEIVKKDGKKTFVIPATNNTLIIEEE